MIGLDTNVLVRYIMQDDKRQAVLAGKLIEGFTEESPGFISLVSVVELSWVLGTTGYALSKSQLIEALNKLMAVDSLIIERIAVVAGAVRAYKQGKADFADYLIERSAAQAGCQRTMTFDKTAAKSGGMNLIA